MSKNNYKGPYEVSFLKNKKILTKRRFGKKCLNKIMHSLLTNYFVSTHSGPAHHTDIFSVFQESLDLGGAKFVALARPIL